MTLKSFEKLRYMASSGERRGKVVPTTYCGIFVDRAGVRWNAYSSTVLDLSAMVRLERQDAPGKRPRFVYDPGNGFRKTLSDRPDWSTGQPVLDREVV